MTDQTTRHVTLMVTHPGGDGHLTLDHLLDAQVAKELAHMAFNLDTVLGEGRHITLHMPRRGMEPLVIQREVDDDTADRVIAAMLPHMPEHVRDAL